MKTYYVTLTSEQLPPIVPSVLDHWFFMDPVLGDNFFYPATADGGIWALSALNATYTAFVCGGEFFPWGYQTVDQIQDITLIDLKGDTTIVFVPSAIDITYHDVLKIVYDPGNGERPVIVNRPIVPPAADFSEEVFLGTSNPNTPTKINKSFNYYASASKVTYFPKVTALYGDMTRLYYNFTVNIFPNSIYDIDNVHLVAAAPAPGYNASTCAYEIESKDAIALNVLSVSVSA